MIRKQFFIDEDENTRLKSEALRSGKSEGELIREGVMQVLDRQTATEEDWKVGLRRLKGMWADGPEIDEFMELRRDARRRGRERLLRAMDSNRK